MLKAGVLLCILGISRAVLETSEETESGDRWEPRRHSRCPRWGKWVESKCLWFDKVYEQIPDVCKPNLTATKLPDWIKDGLESKMKEPFDVLKEMHQERGSPPPCGYCSRKIRCRTREPPPKHRRGRRMPCKRKEIEIMPTECAGSKPCVLKPVLGGCPSLLPPVKRRRGPRAEDWEEEEGDGDEGNLLGRRRGRGRGRGGRRHHRCRPGHRGRFPPGRRGGRGFPPCPPPPPPPHHRRPPFGPHRGGRRPPGPWGPRGRGGGRGRWSPHRGGGRRGGGHPPPPPPPPPPHRRGRGGHFRPGRGGGGGRGRGRWGPHGGRGRHHGGGGWGPRPGRGGWNPPPAGDYHDYNYGPADYYYQQGGDYNYPDYGDYYTADYDYSQQGPDYDHRPNSIWTSSELQLLNSYYDEEDQEFSDAEYAADVLTGDRENSGLVEALFELERGRRRGNRTRGPWFQWNCVKGKDGGSCLCCCGFFVPNIDNNTCVNVAQWLHHHHHHRRPDGEEYDYYDDFYDNDGAYPPFYDGGSEEGDPDGPNEEGRSDEQLAEEPPTREYPDPDDF